MDGKNDENEKNNNTQIEEEKENGAHKAAQKVRQCTHYSAVELVARVFLSLILFFLSFRLNYVAFDKHTMRI